MENWVDLLSQTYEVARGPVARLDESQLAFPTPCSEWSVRNVVEHTIGTIDRFGAAAGALSAAAPVGSSAERTLVERFDVAVARNLAAWDSLPDWSATLTVPFGEFPAEVAAAINQLDVLVHSWDIGAAVGVTVALPDDLADVAMRIARVRVPMGRGGVFGTEVPARGSTPSETLLAFTGRDTAVWPSAICA